MADDVSDIDAFVPSPHDHVFLGTDHAHAERRTWSVIWLCAAMMAIEILGGVLVHSIALVADGLHMSTHAGALLLAALAYSYARRHAGDSRFCFGTGKLGDLAGFTSAIVLGLIALLIGWEALGRLLAPEPIAFAEAIPIAALGLVVNLASAWLLGALHHHHHDHGHDETRRVQLAGGAWQLDIHEDGVPPRFRLRPPPGTPPALSEISLETLRPDGSRQMFTFAAQGGLLESIETIPEPHEFAAHLRSGDDACRLAFSEHAHHHSHHDRDNNMRAAVVHVAADAAVSVLVIVGLLLARAFGWVWMDPLAGLVGALVIANWSFGLLRDTGSILLDMNPDHALTERMRRDIEADGDRLTDLHVWRLGPGHLAAVLSVITRSDRAPSDYRARLRQYPALSHITVEVQHTQPG